MPITKRRLTQWRQTALKALKDQAPTRMSAISPTTVANNRILNLTQELIDQHLLAEADKETEVRKSKEKKDNDKQI